MKTPSLYSKAGNSNCVDNLVEDFAEYVEFRAEEFNLRFKYDNIPAKSIMAEVETFTFHAELAQLMSLIVDTFFFDYPKLHLKSIHE